MVDRLPIDRMDSHDDSGNGYAPPAEEDAVHYESHPEYFETSLNTLYHRNPDENVNVAMTNEFRRKMINGLIKGCTVPPELEYDGKSYRLTENHDESGLLVIKYLVHSAV